MQRKKLNEPVEKRQLAMGRGNPPLAITIPPPSAGWGYSDSSNTTPRANGSQHPPMTPGLAIGLATPAPPVPSVPEGFVTPLSPVDRFSTQIGRKSAEKEDYFSDVIQSPDATTAPKFPPQTPAAETRPSEEKPPPTPSENGKGKEKEKGSSTPFGKKFRMNMSFGSKKLGRSASTTAVEKPAVVDEKAEESESSSNNDKEFADSLLGVIQKMHAEYDKQLADNPDCLVESRIVPAPPNDTPVLDLPPATKVIIQEETSGGSAELYRGTVASVGADADTIERVAPLWLGEVLLLNTLPVKEPVKVSFVLYPWRDSLPAIAAADGNNRLNANRMLRVKKILGYVAERIDPVDPEADVDRSVEVLKPEEYLELYCNDQVSFGMPGLRLAVTTC